MSKIERLIYWCGQPDCPSYKKECHAGSHRWGYSPLGEKVWIDRPVCPQCGKLVEWENRMEDAPDISLPPEYKAHGSSFSSLDDAGKKAVLHKRYKQAYKKEDGAARREEIKKQIIKDTMNYTH